MVVKWFWVIASILVAFIIFTSAFSFLQRLNQIIKK